MVAKSRMEKLMERMISKSPELQKEYEQERFILSIAEQIETAIDDARTYPSILAEAVGISEEHLNRMLTGSKEMPIRTLFGIAKALGYELTIELNPKTKKAKRTSSQDDKDMAERYAKDMEEVDDSAAKRMESKTLLTDLNKVQEYLNNQPAQEQLSNLAANGFKALITRGPDGEISNRIAELEKDNERIRKEAQINEKVRRELKEAEAEEATACAIIAQKFDVLSPEGAIEASIARQREDKGLQKELEEAINPAKMPDDIKPPQGIKQDPPIVPQAPLDITPMKGLLAPAMKQAVDSAKDKPYEPVSSIPGRLVPAGEGHYVQLEDVRIPASAFYQDIVEKKKRNPKNKPPKTPDETFVSPAQDTQFQQAMKENEEVQMLLSAPSTDSKPAPIRAR